MSTPMRGNSVERVRTRVEGNVAVMTLCGVGVEEWGTLCEEHRLNPVLLTQMEAALDGVEGNPAVRAVVVSGEGRFWSNGLDLKWMDAFPAQADALQHRVERLLARLLTFPVPTVAALNGHTAAAGAMLALSLDQRVMNAHRGYFFVPGSHIGLIYSKGMAELLKAKTPNAMHNALIVQSARFTAAQLMDHKVVEKVAAPSSVLDEALTLAGVLSQHKPYEGQRDVMTGIKKRVYDKAFESLLEGGENMGFATRASKL